MNSFVIDATDDYIANGNDVAGMMKMMMKVIMIMTVDSDDVDENDVDYDQ